MRQWMFVLAAISAGVLCASDIRLKGGVLQPGRDVQVESDTQDLNFMYACRFSDGAVHLQHSKGVHTVSESYCCDISKDNGRSWQHVKDCLGKNAFNGLDGRKYQVACWDPKRTKEHTLKLFRWNDEKMARELATTCVITLPYASGLQLHRDVIRTKSGKLLVPAYGNIQGEKKLHNFVIESADDGRSWKFTSDIAKTENSKTSEGPNETTIFQLKDGRICAFFRDDPMNCLWQSFSSDEGKTWSKPEEITLFRGCASPNGIVLADGTIVVTSGRPNAYLLVDFSGTGKEYQKVMVYCGSGSSYSSVMEIAPNEILLIYDESAFAGWLGASPFARIHACTFKVVRNDKVATASDDPLAAIYGHIFRPVSVKKIIDEKPFYMPGINYKPAKENPDYPATMDVIQIAERPHPVLRLVSHGDPKILAGSQWAKFKVPDSLANITKARIGMEFRLNDRSESRPQLQMNAVVGATAQSSGYFACAWFASDRIDLLVENPRDPQKMAHKVIPYDIGTTAFHAFALEADAATGLASLYKEGDSKPVITFKMPMALGTPAIMFGDGSGDIYGSSDISYFAWNLE